MRFSSFQQWQCLHYKVDKDEELQAFEEEQLGKGDDGLMEEGDLGHGLVDGETSEKESFKIMGPIDKVCYGYWCDFLG